MSTCQQPGHAGREAIVPEQDAAQEDDAIEAEALPCLLLQQGAMDESAVLLPGLYVPRRHCAPEVLTKI